MIVFYPIKPVYSDRIFSGEKTFELRKRLPSSDVSHILVYSTVPTGMIVGYAKVKALHKKPIDDLWRLVSKKSGIIEQDYRDYFDGAEYACAIEIEDVRKFVRPFPVSDISSDFTVPQSFCYLDDKVFKKLKRRKAETI